MTLPTIIPTMEVLVVPPLGVLLLFALAVCPVVVGM